MDIPHYVYRDDSIYSLCPEMKDIDAKLGPYFGKGTLAQLSDEIIDIYKQIKETNTHEEMCNSNLYTKSILYSYVSYLTIKIEKLLNPLSNTEAFSLLDQKINILENTYSNLISSSQQTSNSS